jgi:hemoglobin/transferrin/lactoferrin receptor protein
MVQKTANGQGSPHLRGFTGYRTLAVIDGVRYNNSVYRDGPNEYFSLIDVHTLDRIELLQGPSSVRYGSDAIGGTVRLSTRPTDFMAEAAGLAYLRGSQSYRYSSAEDSHVSRTSAEFGRGESWGLRLGLTHEDFGDVLAAEIGRQRATGYAQTSRDARFDLRISDSWALIVNHQEAVQDDVWRTHSTIYAESFSGTQPGTDLRRLKDLTHSLTYAKLEGSELGGFIDAATLTLSFQSWSEDGDRVTKKRSRTLESFDSRMLGADLRLESLLPTGRIAFGADFYGDHVDSGRRDYLPDGSLDRIRIQGPVGDDASYTWLGAYLQAETSLSDHWDLIAGSRVSRNEAKIGRFEDPATGKAASFSDAWTSLVSSVHLSRNLTEDAAWQLLAGVSQSFRAPNLGDLSRYGSSRSDETEVAATSLEPERFLTCEVGVEGSEGPFSISTSVYHTWIKNYITSTPTGRITDGLTEVTKRNSGRGGVFGLELAGSWRWNDEWALTGNLAYLRGDLESYIDAASFETLEEPLSRVQPLTVNLALRWDSPERRWWGEFACTMVDSADRLSRADREDTQRIPPGGTPGYALLGLRGGCVINDHLRASLALENLLDQAYRTHGSGSNEPGFGITTGFTASF